MPRNIRRRARAVCALVALIVVAALLPATASADAPYSVTLTASATAVAVGEEITLMATPNQQIDSPYGVVVRESTGALAVSCFGGVTECESFPIGWDEDKTVTYIARIEDNTGTTSLATSSPVTVVWGAGSSTVDRTAGTDRFATSALLSQSGFAPGVPVAYLATGMNFADALAGGAAAAAEGGPVLTTLRDSLPGSVADELARLDPGTVVILGGTAAISDAVASAAGIVSGAPVVRVAGADRYATAAAISRRAFAPGVDAAFVATGESFPDALSAGVAAAALGVPVLLTQGGALPAVTATELERLDPEFVYVVSSGGAVSEAVHSQLAHFARTSMIRLAGADRYATSAAVTAEIWAPGPIAEAYLATGEVFADALAGVALAGRTGAPMLLVRPTCVPTAVGSELDRLDPTRIVIIGGTGAVSPAVDALTPC